MIDDIDSSSSTLHLLASQALKSWPSKGILKLLEDEDFKVRTLAARELHSRGGKEIFKSVKKLVYDDRLFVKEIAAFTLGQLGFPSYPYKDKSISILCDLLYESNSDVKAASIAALGHLSYAGMPKEVETALILHAEDTNEDVRSCVGYALGNSSGNKSVRSVLNKLKTDKDEKVRSYAILGLELLDNREKESD